MVQRRKEKRSPRVWNFEEEMELAELLKQLVVDGWKSDNGFRPNYQLELEKLLKEKLPNANIKADPHIDSKVKLWKKMYFILFDFISKSGNSFNFITKEITADPEHWKELMEHDRKKFRQLKDTKFPLYEHWCIIFGKDRATGEGAVAANEEDEAEEVAQSEDSSCGDANQPNTMPSSLCGSSAAEAGASSESRKAKKRKALVNLDPQLLHFEAKMEAITNSCNETMKECFLQGGNNDRKEAIATPENRSLVYGAQ